MARARAEHFALGAFNLDNQETLIAVAKAAANKKAPVLVEVSNRGTIEEGDRSYEWTMTSETWAEDRMNQVTVSVTYEVQGQEFDVQLSTLIEGTQISGMQTQ